jgi:hypothetical protein
MWIWTVITTAAKWIAGKLMAAGVAQGVATAIGYVVAGTAAIGAARWLGGKMANVPDIGLGQQGATILANAPSNTAPIPVIYGARRVGGTRVFIGTSNSFDDEGTVLVKNGYLNMVFSLCEGPISEITAVYLNNVEAWPNKDPRFEGENTDVNKSFCYIEPHLGSTTQTVSTALKHIAGFGGGTWSWTDDYRLRGVAYVYVRLQYNSEIWASGMPTVSVDIKGKVVEDTRQPFPSPAGTTISRFSNNPALCIRDYLINDNYGRAIDSTLIDDTTFESAADYCDEVVTFTQTVSDIYSQVSQKRYTLNGVVNTAETSINILDKMLTACRGSLIFSGGKYKLILDKPTTAALTFDESNIMPDYEIILGGKETLANKVTAEFFNPDREWQADFSIVESSTYKEHDNDLLLHKKIELPFTADMLMAKYIANQNLKISRQNVIINFKTTQDGLLAEVGDTIYIKLASPGWDTLNAGAGKIFRVLQIGIEATDEINITAIEYDSEVYTVAAASWEGSPNTQLPSLRSVLAPANITVSEELLFNDPKITNRISISWDKSLSPFVSAYDIAYKKLNDEDLINVGDVNGTQFNIDNLKPGVYTFNVRARNNPGFTSTYAAKLFTVKGTSVLPAINPPGITGVTEILTSSFVGSGVKAKATFSWVAVANADWEALGVTIDHYEVQFKLTSESTTWESPGSSVGTFFEFFDITPGNYNFRVRAVNDANMYSSYAETTAEITGLTAAPADVTNFYLRVDSNEASLSWTPATDLDVKVGGTFEIRHSDLTSGATWEQSIQIGEDVSGISNSVVMPLLKGTYLIKAVDSTGHKSDSATLIVNTISPQLFDYRTFSTITDTSFAGTKTNMVVDSTTGYLKFEADTLIDAMTTDIDDWGLFDSIGGVDTSGSYEFADKIDVEVVGSVNLNGAITFTVVNRSDLWDLREGNIDTWLSIDATDFDGVLAQLYVATTTDDPASGGATWSGWQLFTIGNYYGRGFKFKLEASTADNNYQINVSQLKTVADIYYRIQAESSGIDAGGSTITFDTSFRATPVLGIAAQNMATGDYYTLTSLSKTGFTLQFFNSSGTGVARTADYIARGY